VAQSVELIFAVCYLLTVLFDRSSFLLSRKTKRAARMFWLFNAAAAALLIAAICGWRPYMPSHFFIYTIAPWVKSLIYYWTGIA
jgi:fatty acid desaturase